MSLVKFKNPNKAHFFSNLKIFFTRLFNEISDLTVTDLSIISEQKAINYLERIDLSKIYTIKILRTSVKHTSTDVVIKGISILKGIKTIDSKKAISTALNSKETCVVLEAIEALKQFKNHNIEKSLANCLPRKNKQVANAALWALAEIKSPEAITIIENVLESNNEELAKTASWILKGTKSHKTNRKMRA
jgi:hypothetical protein